MMDGVMVVLILFAAGVIVGFVWGVLFAVAMHAARPRPAGANRNTPHARRRLRSRTQAAITSRRRNATRRPQPWS